MTKMNTFEALHECGKNLALAVVHYQNARLAYKKEHASEEDVQITDAHLQIEENPTRLLFTIEGPIPTTNLDLKHYLPKDRYVWGTLKDWWQGQITSAIQLQTECPKLETAAIIVQIGSKADLDNIGLKCIIDALVLNGVLPSDKMGVFQFLGVEHIETEQPEIRVCVFEPDEKFQSALTILRKKTVFETKSELPRAAFEEGDFFFDPQDL